MTKSQAQRRYYVVGDVVEQLFAKYGNDCTFECQPDDHGSKFRPIESRQKNGSKLFLVNGYLYKPVPGEGDDIKYENTGIKSRLLEKCLD